MIKLFGRYYETEPERQIFLNVWEVKASILAILKPDFAGFKGLYFSDGHIIGSLEKCHASPYIILFQFYSVGVIWETLGHHLILVILILCLA